MSGLVLFIHFVECSKYLQSKEWSIDLANLAYLFLNVMPSCPYGLQIAMSKPFYLSSSTVWRSVNLALVKFILSMHYSRDKC